MSDDDHDLPPRRDTQAPIPFRAPRRRWRRDADGRRAKPRVRKLRLLSILIGLGGLAIVSTLFGMMMAVASDLPQIENRQQYRQEVNSYLYDDMWRPIGILSPPNDNVIDTFQQLGPMMRRAIVSVEDKEFWTDSGVDLRSVGRAFLSDLEGHPTQGASTIAQQFVKNALAEEGNRTILEKVREAAMAFHLTHQWSKEKILTQYLNSIYFGNGAYGAESAARVYFGRQLGYSPDGSGRCGDSSANGKLRSCALSLDPGQAALLAGMVANPSAFNPLLHPSAAWHRRDQVLKDMLAQHHITRAQYAQYYNSPLPTATDVEQPQEPPAAPYFTSWVAPQIISAVGPFKAYYGGLKVRTTIDLPMQKAAEQAISENLPSGPGEPTASLVSIDNATGQIRAMVGNQLVDGQQDYDKYPFNVATQGERQPGSAFKPFTLAVALAHGYGPSSVFDSKPLNLVVPNSAGKEIYHVKNFGNEYSGPIDLTDATAFSDNSVFTQLGLSPGVGTRRVARMARAMGITTPVSTNYAMIIGGLRIGVTPLDMAHAYETIADGGNRVFDPVMGSPNKGAIGLAEIQCPKVKCRGRHQLDAAVHLKRVIPPTVATTIHELLQGVVTIRGATGTSAAISGVDVAGKTGTTSDYGDAWFVGWTPQFTTAVWVGFPNKLIPMTNLYNGGPVEGGTFPALIWRAYMEAALAINAREHPPKRHTPTSSETATSPTGSATAPTQTTDTAPSPSQTATSGATGTAPTPAPATHPTATTPAPAPTTPTPQPTHPQPTNPTPTPSPTTPAPAPAGTGTSGGTGVGG